MRSSRRWDGFGLRAAARRNELKARTKRMVEIDGDDMKVTNPTRLAGGQTLLVWRRAK
jgi:enolase